MIHPQVEDDKPLEDLQKDKLVAENLDFLVERQWFGCTSAIVTLISLIAGGLASISFVFIPAKFIWTAPEKITFICLGGSLLLSAQFFAMIVFKPSYLKGDPKVERMWPVFLGSLVRYTGNVVNTVASKQLFGIVGMLIVELIICSAVYLIYFVDDESDSCCLRFKPWIHKKVRSPPEPEDNIV